MLDASLTTAQMEQLERDLIALLYTIWRTLGKPKKVVTVKGIETNPTTVKDRASYEQA